MKRTIKDPIVYFALGNLGMTAANFIDNLPGYIIIFPIAFLMMIISAILMLKNLLEEKDRVEGGENIMSDSTSFKIDRNMWVPLLAAFSSLFATVVLIELQFLINDGDLDTFKHLIIITGSVHMLIVLISFVAFFKALVKKK